MLFTRVKARVKLFTLFALKSSEDDFTVLRCSVRLRLGSRCSDLLLSWDILQALTVPRISINWTKIALFNRSLSAAAIIHVLSVQTCPDTFFWFNRLPLLTMTIVLRLQEMIIRRHQTGNQKVRVHRLTCSSSYFFFLVLQNFWFFGFAKLMHTCSSWKTHKMASLCYFSSGALAAMMN